VGRVRVEVTTQLPEAQALGFRAPHRPAQELPYEEPQGGVHRWAQALKWSLRTHTDDVVRQWPLEAHSEAQSRSERNQK
jgi:hypothetical protein